MKKYEATSPDVMVIGQAMLSVVSGMLDEVEPILDRYGVSEIDPEVWYPQQLFLDMFKELEQATGGNVYNLVSIGMQILEKAAMPPDIHDIPSGLNALHAYYHMNVCNEDPERGWTVEERAEGVYDIVCTSPFPFDFEYGILYAMVRRFAPPGVDWTVEITERTDEYGAYRLTLK
ncbi:MAG: hypothetical protein GYB64_15130 [Chloroflexi bacterium]|nr:hypothetical protein [Chloroflexota bacterium]